MKHKVCELEGAMLDAAVALAEGREYRIEPYRVSGAHGVTFVRDAPVCVVGVDHFEPSSMWECGGPIIEREKIDLSVTETGWYAAVDTWRYYGPMVISKEAPDGEGATPLIAAMRAFVASKFGEEIELQ